MAEKYIDGLFGTVSGIVMVIPMIMAAVGSLHQWNPLNETWRWLGIENYIRMFFLSYLLAVYDKYRGVFAWLS